MKKVSYRGLFIFIILALVSVYIPNNLIEGKPTSGSIIIVPDDYPSIQDAIDHANPGDIIKVKPGVYYENIVIDKTIELLGSGRDFTIINANYSGDVVKIIKDGVKLSGFTIENSEKKFEKAGIVIQSSDNVIIEDNLIYNNGDQGIRIFSSNHNSIRDNIISNNAYYGIWLYNSKENIIKNNTFLNNGLVIREGDYAYFVQSIENNTVNEKPLYYYLNARGISIPKDAGEIILVNCSNIDIEDFSISNASIGLEIAYSSFINVSHNNFSYNNLNGIRLYYSKDISISSNLLEANGWSGLSIWYSDNNSVSHNIIDDNLYDNIELLFSSNNIVFSNIIRNSLYGIGLKDSNNNIIHWNNIYNNENYGLIAQNSNVDARYNWWGSPFGVIFGDKVVAQNGKICFFPWLLFPNHWI